ncbi:MAG: Hint domain-containing protein [Acetobacteraceae bacterium]
MTKLTWVASKAGFWSTAANWSPEQAPGPGDEVVFDGSGNFSSIASNVSVGILDINDPTLFLSLTGPFSVTDHAVITAGTVSVGSGVAATLHNLMNQGTILIGSNGSLVTTGTYNTDSVMRIGGKGGTLSLRGTLDNAGHTLSTGSLIGSPITSLGTVIGGTLTGDTGYLEVPTTLDGVTWLGWWENWAFTTFIKNGLTLVGENGVGPGSMYSEGSLIFSGNQTLDNGTITLSSPGFADTNIRADGTLTLGPNFSIRQSDALLQFTNENEFSGADSNSKIINLGTIISTPDPFGGIHGGSSVRGTITISDFVNGGMIAVSSAHRAGAVVNVESSRFTNTSAGIINAFDRLGTGDGGFVTVSADTDFTNDGTIISSGGVVDIAPFVQGGGQILITQGGTVDLRNGADAGQDVTFAGAGKLELGFPQLYGGTISGLTKTSSIVMDVAATALSYTDHQLTMQLSGGQTFALTILGDLTLDDFIVNTGSTATTITTNLAVPCFAAGTRIATETRDAVVETLRPGDKVRVFPCGALREIVWIGHRHVDCRRHPNPRAVQPVQIEAGTFGPGLPARDLLLSPDHALYFEGVLIPVRCLVNGDTVAPMDVDTVTYYHVELTGHDILLTEGLPAESYLDTGDRDSFVNGPDAMHLFPAFGDGANAALVRDALACAPLVITGPQVDAARNRAMRRMAARPDADRRPAVRASAAG